MTATDQPFVPDHSQMYLRIHLTEREKSIRDLLEAAVSETRRTDEKKPDPLQCILQDVARELRHMRDTDAALGPAKSYLVIDSANGDLLDLLDTMTGVEVLRLGLRLAGRAVNNLFHHGDGAHPVDQLLAMTVAIDRETVEAGSGDEESLENAARFLAEARVDAGARCMLAAQAGELAEAADAAHLYGLATPKAEWAEAAEQIRRIQCDAPSAMHDVVGAGFEAGMWYAGRPAAEPIVGCERRKSNDSTPPLGHAAPPAPPSDRIERMKLDTYVRGLQGFIGSLEVFAPDGKVDVGFVLDALTKVRREGNGGPWPAGGAEDVAHSAEAVEAAPPGRLDPDFVSGELTAGLADALWDWVDNRIATGRGLDALTRAAVAIGAIGIADDLLWGADTLRSRLADGAALVAARDVGGPLAAERIPALLRSLGLGERAASLMLPQEAPRPAPVALAAALGAEMRAPFEDTCDGKGKGAPAPSGPGTSTPGPCPGPDQVAAWMALSEADFTEALAVVLQSWGARKNGAVRA